MYFIECLIDCATVFGWRGTDGMVVGMGVPSLSFSSSPFVSSVASSVLSPVEKSVTDSYHVSEMKKTRP